MEQKSFRSFHQDYPLFLREISLLRAFHSDPQIVHVSSSEPFSEQGCHLLFDHKGPSLAEFLHAKTPLYYTYHRSLDGKAIQIPKHLPWSQQVLHFWRGMLEAIHVLHSKGVVHQHIQSSNFFLQPSQDHLPLVRLGDFSRAAQVGIHPQGSYAPCPLAPEDLYWQHQHQGSKSSTRSARSHPATFSADMWQVGLVFYETLTNQIPGQQLGWRELLKWVSQVQYKSKIAPDFTKQVFDFFAERYRIQHSVRLDQKELYHDVEALNPDGFELLTRLLDPNPATRITSQEALQHKVFQTLLPINVSLPAALKSHRPPCTDSKYTRQRHDALLRLLAQNPSVPISQWVVGCSILNNHPPTERLEYQLVLASHLAQQVRNINTTQGELFNPMHIHFNAEDVWKFANQIDFDFFSPTFLDTFLSLTPSLTQQRESASALLDLCSLAVLLTKSLCALYTSRDLAQMLIWLLEELTLQSLHCSDKKTRLTMRDIHTFLRGIECVCRSKSFQTYLRNHGTVRFGDQVIHTFVTYFTLHKFPRA